LPPWRISVDIGGTFTDAVLVDGRGDILSFKTLSCPENPARGVLDCLDVAARALSISVEQLMNECEMFVHGSTVATNTILESTGARVGMLVTEGFRDSLEIRRGARVNPWDHRTPYPPVMVPRYLRRPVRERIDRHGGVKIPLDDASVREAVALFRAEKVESVAICFLNSFLNPVHEQQAAAQIKRLAPDLLVSVSSDIAPILGEYERASTTAVDAYVSVRLVSYLSELDRKLQQLGLKHPLLLLKNNGGIGTVADVLKRPVCLCLSGPAAGVGALRHCQEVVGSGDLISVEIGGTSCDVLLMADGRVAIEEHLQIGGYAVAVPSVEVHTIGAGGGSIAGVDAAGALTVGPRGAGAKPGPAAYGLGGTEPTVTDAQLVLGRLRPGSFAGGALSLDLEKARDAIATKVARLLSVSIEHAAAGIVRIAEQHIYHAVSFISVERGLDPRRFTMIPGGGAGGLHGSAVGRMLGCRQIYVPRLGGVFCALGMQYSDLRYDYVRGYTKLLTDRNLTEFEALFVEMGEQARDALISQGVSKGNLAYERAIDLCYRGQQWHVRVDLPATGEKCAKDIRNLFEEQHERLNGHRQEESEIEISKIRLVGIAAIPRLPTVRRISSLKPPIPIAHRPVYLDVDRGFQVTPIYRGADLEGGVQLNGPLIVDEATTTIFVGAQDRLRIDPVGNYIIELQ
jgi:N-methylhydantoinase A